MKWTIRIKRRATSGIYDSELTCYSVVFIHNLVAKSHACNARVPYSSLNGVCVCVVRVEVQIVFFGYTLSLFFRNFKPRLVMPKIQASVSVYRAAKLPPLQPAPCYPEILRYIFVSLCSENSLHLNPRLAIPKLQRAWKLPPPVKSRHAKCPWYPWTERTASNRWGVLS